jgi:hypothetical protein
MLNVSLGSSEYDPFCRTAFVRRAKAIPTSLGSDGITSVYGQADTTSYLVKAILANKQVKQKMIDNKHPPHTFDELEALADGIDAVAESIKLLRRVAAGPDTASSERDALYARQAAGSLTMQIIEIAPAVYKKALGDEDRATQEGKEKHRTGFVKTAVLEDHDDESWGDDTVIGDIHAIEALNFNALETVML